MESAEWEGLIKPQCKTTEDWVYGMVSARWAPSRAG